MMINWGKTILGCILFSTLAACGGGSSSSGGGPPPIVVQSGFYEGTQTLTFSSPGNPGSPETTPFELSVSGAQNAQQVLIRYRQFSGSSSIGANQEFRIPTGQFPIASGQAGVTCSIQLVFEGRFAGTTANGSITGDVLCQPGAFAIDISGTFNVSLALSKAKIATEAEAEYEADFNFGL